VEYQYGTKIKNNGLQNGSNTEAEKGEASDSFKRAGFNWGIGRELYTSPFIWVPRENVNIDEKNKVKDKFYVSRIEIIDKEIKNLEIKNQKNVVVFTTGNKIEDVIDDDEVINERIEDSLRDLIKNLGIKSQEVINALNKFGHKKLAELKISEVADFRKALHE
jgi:hypothetical protein